MKFIIHVEADSKESAITKCRSGEITSIATLNEFQGHIQRQKAEPWPVILMPMKLLAKEGDRGAGDIIARIIGPIGGNAFKIWYKTTFGKDCGCGHRQEVLNERWPL